jgi:hypothetical protein
MYREQPSNYRRVLTIGQPKTSWPPRETAILTSEDWNDVIGFLIFLTGLQLRKAASSVEK